MWLYSYRVLFFWDFVRVAMKQAKLFHQLASYNLEEVHSQLKRIN